MVDSIIFWTFAVLAVVGALGVVSMRSSIYATLMLLVVFVSNAGFFLLNNADFLAIAQVLVYAVGLTIIILFAIMFTGDRVIGQDQAVSRQTKIITAIVLAYTAVVLLSAVQYPFRNAPLMLGSGMASAIQNEGTAALLGQLLFRDFTLPFEVASILLLVAMVGAIVLSKKRLESTVDAQLDANLKYPLDTASHPTEASKEARRRSTHPLNGEDTTATPVAVGPEEASTAV